MKAPAQCRGPARVRAGPADPVGAPPAREHRKPPPRPQRLPHSRHRPLRGRPAPATAPEPAPAAAPAPAAELVPQPNPPSSPCGPLTAMPEPESPAGRSGASRSTSSTMPSGSVRAGASALRPKSDSAKYSVVPIRCPIPFDRAKNSPATVTWVACAAIAIAFAPRSSSTSWATATGTSSAMVEGASAGVKPVRSKPGACGSNVRATASGGFARVSRRVRTDRSSPPIRSAFTVASEQRR